MKRSKCRFLCYIASILLSIGGMWLPSSHAMEAREVGACLSEAAAFDEISAYSSLIERYVNQNWSRENPTTNLFRVTLLTITKRERVEQLHGQYNYCWLTLELGREIRECVACFWEPDEPINPQILFELKGIFEVGRKLTL